MNDRIYVDHAATTPLELEVREAMLPWLGGNVGNASSMHQDGLRAKKAIDEAREQIASALGCLFGEVIFTSSGTEAMNLALAGLALADTGSRRRILVSAAEHHCAIHMQPLLERLNCLVEFVPVDRFARVTSWEAPPDALAFVAMHANNEFGTIQQPRFPAGVHGVCDIVQTFGQMPVSVDELGCDLAVMSAHKLGGPQGVGALYIRGGTPLEPLIRGGGQERDMRAGTESVANIVGFGAAVRLASERMSERSKVKRACRHAFWDEMSATNFEVVTTVKIPLLGEGDFSSVLSGHVHLRIPGVQAEPLLIGLDQLGVSASSGAACSSGSIEPSHVLLAAGYTEAEAREGLRITFGWTNNPDEAREVAMRLKTVAERILSAKGKT